MSIWLNVNPSICSTFTYTPFNDGISNIRAAFPSGILSTKTIGGVAGSYDIRDDIVKGIDKSVCGSIAQLFIGLLLCIPVINIIANISLRLYTVGNLHHPNLLEAQFPHLTEPGDQRGQNLFLQLMVARGEIYLNECYPDYTLELLENPSNIQFTLGNRIVQKQFLVTHENFTQMMKDLFSWIDSNACSTF